MTNAAAGSWRPEGLDLASRTPAIALAPPLLEKMLAAQKAVDQPERARGDDFSFIPAARVITVGAAAFRGAELVTYIEHGPYEYCQCPDGDGVVGILVVLNARLRVLDPESGHSISIPVVGSGHDTPGSKAMEIAITIARRNGFATALNIPLSDDPERPRSSNGSAKRAGTLKREVGRLFHSAGLDGNQKRAIRDWWVKRYKLDSWTKVGVIECERLIETLADKDRGATEILIEIAEAAKAGDELAQKLTREMES